MKFRIVEYSPCEFVVQERQFFFWFNANDGTGRFCKTYPAIAFAEQAIREHLALINNELERTKSEKLKIKNAKYHYVESK